jgi:hypothetical protein
MIRLPVEFPTGVTAVWLIVILPLFLPEEYHLLEYNDV